MKTFEEMYEKFSDLKEEKQSILDHINCFNNNVEKTKSWEIADFVTEHEKQMLIEIRKALKI